VLLVILSSSPVRVAGAGEPRRFEVAVAVIQEWESQDDRSTTVYDELGQAMNVEANPPNGLISHAAGFDGNTWRIFDIWESEEAFGRFQEQRLVPAPRDQLVELL
jgi:hypothetical protein